MSATDAKYALIMARIESMVNVTDHFKTNHQRSNQNQPVISLSL